MRHRDNSFEHPQNMTQQDAIDWTSYKTNKVLLGANGSGKSATIVDWCLWLLTHTDVHIVIVDFDNLHRLFYEYASQSGFNCEHVTVTQSDQKLQGMMGHTRLTVVNLLPMANVGSRSVCHAVLAQIAYIKGIVTWRHLHRSPATIVIMDNAQVLVEHDYVMELALSLAVWQPLDAYLWMCLDDLACIDSLAIFEKSEYEWYCFNAHKEMLSRIHKLAAPPGCYHATPWSSDTIRVESNEVTILSKERQQRCNLNPTSIATALALADPELYTRHRELVDAHNHSPLTAALSLARSLDEAHD